MPPDIVAGVVIKKSLFLAHLIRSLRPSLSSTASMSTECTLKCSNGGSCFVGSADFGFHAIDQHLPWTGETDVNGMYCCVCSTGFTGVQCEVVFESCGKNQHPCFNGSTCKEAADGESNCDCSSATSASPVAGHFCQHEATSLWGACW